MMNIKNINKLAKGWKTPISCADHPAKQAKLISQRKIQKTSCEEVANHARASHDDLMATHKTNISDV